MKKLNILALSLLMASVFPASAVLAAELVKIKPNGKTVIGGLIGGIQVQATITTHEIDIGKGLGSIPEPRQRLTNCTYTRIPCSLVDNLEVSINGKTIVVPRSAFADMSDLNNMAIGAKEKLFTLTTRGGDTSGSYAIEIIFDENRVLKRRYFDAFDPREAVQETNYYLPASIE